MNLLSAENISKAIGDRNLFEGINFGLNVGDRVGLIGVNGAGKTTLLNILGGNLLSDKGLVSIRKGVRVGFLGQNPPLNEQATVFENVFDNGHKLTSLIKKYELLINHPNTSNAYLLELDELTAEMTRQDAWTYEQQVKEIISRLGIGEFLDRQVNQLSGGQRKRVALAKILAEEPDLLILDEPTNHLDIDTVEWLQRLISTKFSTLLLVTHDRYFLDAVVNQIVELDQGRLHKYQGNYAWFLEKKAERQEVEQVVAEKARNLFRKELEWIRRQPKARGTKAKYRVDAFEDLKGKTIGPKIQEQIKLSVKDRFQGGKIVEARRVGKSLGDECLVKDFHHYFQKGEKAGIIGPNGIGKTTLLKMLAGELMPDKGEVARGDNCVVGYYKQEDFLQNNEGEMRIIDVVNEIAETFEMADGSKISPSQFLTRFNFPPAEQYKQVNKLSGGERKRLQLLKILIKNPNFLILDEPTNDLDLGTLNVLEEFLESFKGSLLLVSHDRYFMDKLVEHVFVFEGNGEIRDFPGNYTDYKLWKDEQKELEKANANVKSAPAKQTENNAPSKEKKKLSFKEQKELEVVEMRLETLESRKQELVESMSTGTLGHVDLANMANDLQQIEAELDEKMFRWMELSE